MPNSLFRQSVPALYKSLIPRSALYHKSYLETYFAKARRQLDQDRAGKHLMMQKQA